MLDIEKFKVAAEDKEKYVDMYKKIKSQIEKKEETIASLKLKLEISQKALEDNALRQSTIKSSNRSELEEVVTCSVKLITSR